MAKGYTEDELEMLTEEEREGLLEEDTDEEDSETAEAETEAGDAGTAENEDDAGEDDKEEETGNKDDGEDDETEAKTDDEAKEEEQEEEAEKAPEAEAGKKKADEGDDAPDKGKAETDAASEVDDDLDETAVKATRPIRNWVAPAHAKTKITEFRRELAKLEQQFDDGEIDKAELTEKRFELEDEIDAQRRAAQRTQAAQKEWLEDSVPSFLQEHPEYSQSKTLHTAMDMEVRKLQSSGDYDPFDPAILEIAHRRVMKDVRGFVSKTAPKPKSEDKAPETGKKEPVKKKAAPEKKPERDMPPNIGKLPAAQVEDTQDGEFAWLDRLEATDRLKFEDELAKLPEEKRERYLAS